MVKENQDCQWVNAMKMRMGIGLDKMLITSLLWKRLIAIYLMRYIEEGRRDNHIQLMN